MNQNAKRSVTDGGAATVTVKRRRRMPDAPVTASAGAKKQPLQTIVASRAKVVLKLAEVGSDARRRQEEIALELRQMSADAARLQGAVQLIRRNINFLLTMQSEVDQ